MTTVLRPWVTDDAHALLTAVRTTPDLVTQFGGAELRDVDDAAAFVRESLPHTETARCWAIVRDGVAVGNVALTAIERRHDTAWASYWVAGSARGHGLATRALLAVSRWADEHRLFRLELGHRVNNPASCVVATRAGFAAEGVERAKLRYGSERFDVETHARLATDPVPAGSPLPLLH